jgi:hypothetical protein
VKECRAEGRPVDVSSRRLRTVAAKEYELIYLRFLMFPYAEGLLYDL